MLRNGHRQMLGKHLYRSAFRSEDQARQVHANHTLSAQEKGDRKNRIEPLTNTRVVR